jgi:hypothetical protein
LSGEEGVRMMKGCACWCGGWGGAVEMNVVVMVKVTVKVMVKVTVKMEVKVLVKMEGV